MRQRWRVASDGDGDATALVRDMPDGVVVVDELGIVIFLNPAAEDLFGRDAGDLLGYPMGLPIAVEANAARITLVTASGEPRQADMRVSRTRWNGRKAWLAVLREVVAAGS
jgi:PAS domain S-box-containing protein